MKSEDEHLQDTALDTNAIPHHDDRAAPVVDPGTPRYVVGELLGRGGMGEVVRARDARVDRDVAFKRLRTADPAPDEIARFLREARIQARLDHPAVVPVHDLGVDDQGRPFFTMKRLVGTTLADRLVQEPALQPLLRAFVDVCLAIDFAHGRGIVHRDLKPANIMLGDYGEVYVLDWGLARDLRRAAGASSVGRLPTDTEHTGTGAFLGTPGYMAPEQIQDAASVEPAADIYALGAILFELLAGAPLHPRGHAALASTLDGVAGSPAAVATTRAVPPELDQVCVAMLAREPAQRPTARQVADKVQAFLDGDRDLARRRQLATDELARAQRAFAADSRAEAMQAAGRALALDPALGGAAELVGRLMLEPPAEPPPALAAELRATEAAHVRAHARSARFTYSPALLLVPLAWWNGVRNPSLIAAFVALAVVLSLAVHRLARQTAATTREIAIYVLGTGVLVALMTRVCGPLMLAPVLACTVFMSCVTYPSIARQPIVAVIAGIAGWLVPCLLEAVGALSPTWAIEGDRVISQSAALALGGPPTIALVFGGTLVILAVGGYQALALSRGQLEAQRQLTTQAWQLRQLLPDR
ncbi:MAG TPA: serine/threonine-protein kinase [Kofleriaceae bacterium]|nr:serine/threonine-protein kinase [Kofleriaceae bacterium]